MVLSAVSVPVSVSAAELATSKEIFIRDVIKLGPQISFIGLVRPFWVKLDQRQMVPQAKRVLGNRGSVTVPLCSLAAAVVKIERNRIQR